MIAAASDAMKGSEKARLVIAAPAEAEERWRRACERTICGWIGIYFLWYNPLVIARRHDEAISFRITTVRLLRFARNDRKKSLAMTGKKPCNDRKKSLAMTEKNLAMKVLALPCKNKLFSIGNGANADFYALNFL